MEVDSQSVPRACSDTEARRVLIRSLARERRHTAARRVLPRFWRRRRRRHLLLLGSLAAAVVAGFAPSAGRSRGVWEVARVDAAGPVRWSSCLPIHYVINPEHAPPEGVAAVHAAVERAASASGLRFVYDGLTDEPARERRSAYQVHRYGKRWAPVLVAWDSARRDDVASYPFPNDPTLGPAVYGRTMPTARPVPGARGQLMYVSGQVVLNADRDTSYHGAPDEQTVILHEFGHLLGLAHVDDRRELMHGASVPRPEGVRYGPGDRRGLAMLGSGPCRALPSPVGG